MGKRLLVLFALLLFAVPACAAEVRISAAASMTDVINAVCAAYRTEHPQVSFANNFAASGTLARQIIDGAKQVSLFGEEIAVRARIHTINGFSAHADQAELLAWHAPAQAPRTFLVHGDEDAMRAFALKLRGTRVEMPALNQSFEL